MSISQGRWNSNSHTSAMLARCPQCQEPTSTIKKVLSLIITLKEVTKHSIIEQTIKAINQLPEDKAKEISEFADIVTKRYEEHKLSIGIQQLTSNSNGFSFLDNEEELYSETDLKEVYNG